MAVARQDVPAKDRWNVESLYPTSVAWEQELKTAIPFDSPPFFPSIAKFRGQMGTKPEVIKEALDGFFKEERILRKLYTYAHLRHDEDIADDANKKRFEKITTLYHLFAQETSWIEPEILAIDETKLQKFLQDPILEEYRFFLEKLLRLKPHTLDEAQEKLLALAEQPLQTTYKAFSAINDADFKFGQVLNSKGETKDLTHASYALYLRDKDRTLRQNAFTTYHKKFQEFENTLAELLSGLVQKHLFSAKAKNYNSCLEAALFPKNIDPSTYHSLIDAVHEKIGELHKYMKLRKKLLKLDEMHL